MPAADLEQYFPNLQNSGYDITSDIDVSYNCVAFAVLDDTRWWDPNDPDGFWPAGIPRDDTVDGFRALFESLDFERCLDAVVEPGFEKVAIYGTASGAFTHVARQLASGEWTSKLGELEDIVHATLDGLDSQHYGSVRVILKKQSTAA